MMDKRGIIFGPYDTAAHGWTLASWTLEPAVQKTYFIDKRGGHGSFDWSTALTDGIPLFKDRKLTATLELSDGDRMDREYEIRAMVNQLTAARVEITLPDDPDHYMVGLLQVARKYNDNAHGAVEITATCEPWKYSKDETTVALTATTTEQTVELINYGVMAVLPTLTVGGTARLGYGDASLSLSAGTHQWPDLLLTPGAHTLTYSGSGALTIKYREAVIE